MGAAEGSLMAGQWVLAYQNLQLPVVCGWSGAPQPFMLLLFRKRMAALRVCKCPVQGTYCSVVDLTAQDSKKAAAGASCIMSLLL